MDFYHKSVWVVYFMRKRGKFVLFTGYNFPRSSTNCMNYIDLGERSISRKNTILLPLFFLLPLVVVAWPFINFVSVQLSMITGKGCIAETSWLATLASARQKIAGVVYILLEIIAKQHFLTRLGFNFFKLFTGGWQAGLHSRPPELPKLMGLKELGLEFLC